MEKKKIVCNIEYFSDLSLQGLERPGRQMNSAALCMQPVLSSSYCQFIPLIHTSMYSNRESHSRQPATPINSVTVNERLAPVFPIPLLQDI